MNFDNIFQLAPETGEKEVEQPINLKTKCQQDANDLVRKVNMQPVSNAS